jgi:predicted HTH transcriptional regulator
MRRLGICEEKGGGIDKVISYNEIYQLPAQKFLFKEKHTSIMYSYKTLNQMDKKDKVKLVISIVVLRYVSNDKMTNNH